MKFAVNTKLIKISIAGLMHIACIMFFSFERLLEDPIVIYSAKFWKNEREKKDKN